MLRSALISALAVMLSTLSTNAATISISVGQSGSDVVFTGSGEVDLTGLVSANYNGSTVAGYGSEGFGEFTQFSSVFSATSPQILPVGPSVQQFDMVSGDVFGVTNSFDVVLLPENYVSLDPISFVWTLSNSTVEALNLSFGELAAFGQNTVTLSPVAAVPLPATLPLLIAAIGGFGFVARQRAALPDLRFRIESALPKPLSPARPNA
ncbi:MAG: VPLPA-CTERM sorting domain-containing protein [Pseudomonadota bacterium]